MRVAAILFCLILAAKGFQLNGDWETQYRAVLSHVNPILVRESKIEFPDRDSDGTSAEKISIYLRHPHASITVNTREKIADEPDFSSEETAALVQDVLDATKRHGYEEAGPPIQDDRLFGVPVLLHRFRSKDDARKDERFQSEEYFVRETPRALTIVNIAYDERKAGDRNAILGYLKQAIELR
jgi:hypothetical protein